MAVTHRSISLSEINKRINPYVKKMSGWENHECNLDINHAICTVPIDQIFESVGFSSPRSSSGRGREVMPSSDISGYISNEENRQWNRPDTGVCLNN